MNYMIDGHNLIGKLTSLDLGMVDDELRLIELLSRFSQHNHGNLEVYFDGAPPDQNGPQNFGRVKAHFVPRRQTADQAIIKRLSKLGKSARNWMVVTSDHSIQVAAHEAHARVMPSEEFARRMQRSLWTQSNEKASLADEPLSEQEVKEWLAIFKGKSNPK
jgi:predicted RNA-binding protein with PIN domain